MRITPITAQPIIQIPFLNAGRGPGAFYVDQLPVHTAEVVGLPDELDAIVATADLQGRERFEDGNGGPLRLLGELLPEQLSAEILPRLEVSSRRTGVILAGDFYTVPGLDKRGGSGDVTGVWRAFSDQFRWVAGVAGNHDMFGDHAAPTSRLGNNTHYLDGTSTTLDSLSVVGIGGIIGNPRKPHRKTDDEFVELIEKSSEVRPDILVMHDGPDLPEESLRGSPRIRLAVEQSSIPLIVRGHAHWPAPLVNLANGTQVLNVHGRVVVMHHKSKQASR